MSKVFLTLLLVLFFALPLFAQSLSVDTAWVRRYNGPANQNDWASALALDGSGNVYVTGGSYVNGPHYDYATVKYDSSGNQRWVQRYNGPGDSTDYVYAIAVDISGNVYVTGGSFGSGTSWDYATVKYDSSGNQLWVQRYNGPGNGWDLAYAIALDDSGSVCVTGISMGSGTSWDYATVKYDPDGNQLWVQRYNGPGNNWDEASAITSDGSGNVYVTGTSVGSGTDFDYATVKYNADGNQLWVQRYNGPGNSYDKAYAITVNGSGNIYITGQSYNDETYQDYATVKYDPDGNQLWVQRYNGPGNYQDVAYAITLDSFNNIYVAGESDGGETDYDYATVKYDSSGNQRWVQRYNGPGNYWDEASAIALDGSGNIYITGRSIGSGTSWDYATVKYDSSGNQLWARRYSGPGNSRDEASAIALDGSGNIYVAGYSYGDSVTRDDYATIKYVQFLRGDANRDMSVTIADIVYLVCYLFKREPQPYPVLQVGDTNCDGKVTISDIVYLVAYLFKHGPVPCI